MESIYSSVPSVFSDQEENTSDVDEHIDNRIPAVPRKRIEPEKTRILLRVFELNQKPDTETRVALARQLDMAPRSVQIWFQNRRAKLKRDMNQQRLNRPVDSWNPNISPSISPVQQQHDRFIHTALPASFSNQMVLTPTRVLPLPPQPIYALPQKQSAAPMEMQYPTLPVISIIPDSTPQEESNGFTGTDSERANFNSLFGNDDLQVIPAATENHIFNSNGRDFLLNHSIQVAPIDSLRKTKSMNDLRDDENEPPLKRRKSMDLLAMIDSL